MSWNLAKGNGFLSDVSLAALKKLYKNEKNTKPKQRLLCAIHRKNGMSLDAINDIMQVSRRTVHEWLRKFEERGISAKDSIKQTGRPPQLTEGQRKELLVDLENGPKYNKNGLWSTKEVRELLEKKYKISFVPQHAYRILVSLGFSIQCPRKKHHQSASDEETARFKKKPAVYPTNTGKKVLWCVSKTKQHLA